MIYEKQIDSCARVLEGITKEDPIYRDIIELKRHYEDLNSYEMAIRKLTPIICAEFRVTEQDLKSEDQHRRVADARNAFCFLMMKLVGAHPRVLSRFLGRDRSTIYNSVKRANWLSETEAEYRRKVNTCKQLLIQSLA